MRKENRLSVLEQVKELSLEWDLSTRETMEEMVYLYFECTPISEEQLEAEFYSLNDEELLNKLCELLREGE